METRILNFFKKDRSFCGAVELYNEIGLRPRLKMQLSCLPESTIKGILFDELREMACISNLEFQYLLMTPVISTSNRNPGSEEQESMDGVTNNDVTLNQQGNNPAIGKKIALNTLPFFRLQDEFPFLNKPDCPPELKILVSDMLTAHERYTTARMSLFSVETNAEILEYSRTTVENYLENRAIWEELNYYKTTGQVLGKHILFSRLQQTTELRSMTVFELFKLKKRLENNISQNKRIMKKNPNHTNTGKRLGKEKNMKYELDEINNLLNNK